MATKYWIGSGAGNFNDNTRWSTTSGGSNDTTAATTGDDATFNGGGTGNCTLTADVTCSKLLLNTGYTGTFNTSTYNLTLTNNSGTTLNFQGAGTLNLGSGNHTIGSADGGDILFQTGAATFIAGTCVIDLYGSCTTTAVASATVNTNWTLNCNGTGAGTRVLQLENPGGYNVHFLNIQGDGYVNRSVMWPFRMTVAADKSIAFSNLSGTPLIFFTNVTLNTGSSITFANDNGSNGPPLFLLSQNGSITNNGSIDADITLAVTDGGQTFGPGTYDCILKFGRTGASANAMNFSFQAGTYVFTNTVSFFSGLYTGASGSTGTFTYTNGTNSTLTFEADVTMTNNAGSFTWQKGTNSTNIFAPPSSATQTVTLVPVVAMGNLEIDAAGATVNISGHQLTVEDFTISGGTVDLFAENEFTINGDVLISGSDDIAIDTPDIAIGGSWDSSGTSTLSFPQNGVLEFSGSGSIESDLTVALPESILLAGSDYSIGAAGARIVSLHIDGDLAIDGNLIHEEALFSIDSGVVISGTGELTFLDGASIVNNGRWSHTGTITTYGNVIITSLEQTLSFANDFVFNQSSDNETVDFFVNMTFLGNVTFNQTVSGKTFTGRTNSNNLILKKNLSMTEVTTDKMLWERGSGLLMFNGTTTQTVNLLGNTVEDILVAGTNIVFSQGFKCNNINISTGIANFSSKTYTTNNFTITAGSSVNLTGLAGSRFTVLGNLLFNGVSPTNLLDLRAASTWTLKVFGSAFMNRVNVKNCNAGGGSLIVADGSTADGGGNVNFSFNENTTVTSLVYQGLDEAVPGYECSEITTAREQIKTRVTWKYVKGAYVPAPAICNNPKLKAEFLQ